MRSQGPCSLGPVFPFISVISMDRMPAALEVPFPQTDSFGRRGGNHGGVALQHSHSERVPQFQGRQARTSLELYLFVRPHRRPHDLRTSFLLCKIPLECRVSTTESLGDVGDKSWHAGILLFRKSTLSCSPSASSVFQVFNCHQHQIFENTPPPLFFF